MVEAARAASSPSLEGSVELLKRVKATETEWDQALRAARSNLEETVSRLHAEADSTVRAALAAAEAERARALERARAEIDQEVATILAEGKASAESAARVEGKRPEDQRDRVIRIVLGPFAGE